LRNGCQGKRADKTLSWVVLGDEASWVVFQAPGTSKQRTGSDEVVRWVTVRWAKTSVSVGLWGTAGKELVKSAGVGIMLLCKLGRKGTPQALHRCGRNPQRPRTLTHREKR
jgi:hypothetical protein